MEITTKTNFVQVPDRDVSHAARDADMQDSHKVKVAKDFESVLLNKVFEEMQNTIPESELVEDDTSKQMQGIFWMYMADDMGSRGGFGLWKEIYNQMNKEQSPAALDSKL
ncbi:MAG: hypothetical protein A2Y07_09275 [Planctomycetes bacterium GWF2_50_10]|nr:MAG: hypothetical protein A2Y07_09275 [Planctomycetes bacterium GWF2_50_10]